VIAVSMPADCWALHMQCRVRHRFRSSERYRFCNNTVWEEVTLNQVAVDITKMQEIVTLLANLRHAAYQLPDGAERQNALREIRGYQIRMAAFVRRLGSAA